MLALADGQLMQRQVHITPVSSIARAGLFLDRGDVKKSMGYPGAAKPAVFLITESHRDSQDTHRADVR
jgi:hypothetical protein